MNKKLAIFFSICCALILLNVNYTKNISVVYKNGAIVYKPQVGPNYKVCFVGDESTNSTFDPNPVFKTKDSHGDPLILNPTIDRSGYCLTNPPKYLYVHASLRYADLDPLVITTHGDKYDYTYSVTDLKYSFDNYTLYTKVRKKFQALTNVGNVVYASYYYNLKIFIFFTLTIFFILLDVLRCNKYKIHVSLAISLLFDAFFYSSPQDLLLFEVVLTAIFYIFGNKIAILPLFFVNNGLTTCFLFLCVSKLITRR